MKRYTFVLLLLFVFVLGITAIASAKPSAPPDLNTLEPGGFREIDQDLTVNIVFVGYEQGAGDQDIDNGAFLAELPSTYRPVNRYPSFYKGNEFLGLTFNFDYNVVYTDDAFEDDLFGYLSSIATAEPLTLYQELYNLQVNRRLDIPDNHFIDAPSVEKWLANNAGSISGVDTTNYTIFFINWHGRDDFMYHVYTKIGEPDPDTGYDFGLQRESRKIIAWGGTTPDDEETGLGSLHRIWFYDLSAGPEAWTDNWNVDDDLGYRMPPVWEYGNLSGYRSFDDLSGDLGKVTRYVGIDLLFTTSPLYKPAISPPGLPEDVQLDVTVYQIDPASDGTTYFDPPLITQELNELQPYNTFTIEINGKQFKAPFERVYLCFYNEVSCYGNRLFGDAFADLFLFHNDKIVQYIDGDGDYEVPIFAFNTTDDLWTCCLGFADDNWADGTQSFVFAWDAPFLRTSGYGFTTTTIHEVGHHIGMSHPHDGYDYEADVDFGPGGPFYFAWSGDESNSMMSYIDLNWDFSQFDRDNMSRFMTVLYINQANTILSDIYKSPRAGRVSSQLISADSNATAALAKYALMDYEDAAADAQAAFNDVLAAAEEINVQVEPQAWQADYKAKAQSDKFIDTVDYQRMKP